MNFLELKIPGKVMLSGEFAVLYGGSSVLMPVPRYLHVKVSSAPPANEYSHALKVAWEYPIERLSEFEDKNKVEYVLENNQEFLAEDESGKIKKLGIGSSAAQAVAAVTLRYLRAGYSIAQYRKEIALHAIEAHRKAQNGLGSGADVATCAYNQPIKFSISENSCQIVPVYPTENNKIPLNLLWTGKPANTRDLVLKFSEWAKNDIHLENGLLNQLIKSSHELSAHWFKSTPDFLFDYLDRFSSLMKQCSQKAQINYCLDIQTELDQWARKFGGRAKPTGAGGGDMTLLIGNLPLEKLKGLIIPLEY